MKMTMKSITLVFAILLTFAATTYAESEVWVIPHLGYGTQDQKVLQFVITIESEPVSNQSAMFGPLGIEKCGEFQVSFPTCDPTKYTWCRPRFQTIWCQRDPRNGVLYEFRAYPEVPGYGREAIKLTPEVATKLNIQKVGTTPINPEFCVFTPVDPAIIRRYLCSLPNFTQPVYGVKPATVGWLRDWKNEIGERDAE